MEQKEKVKYFNQSFNRILNIFPIDMKIHDSITIYYYIFALSTRITQFMKRTAKGTLAKNYEEAVAFEKDLCTIGVIMDNESSKDSKDMGKISQASLSKAKDMSIKYMSNKLAELQ